MILAVALPRRARAASLSFVSLALILLPLAACGRDAEEESETSETVHVDVATARRGAVQSWLRATGVVAAAPGGEQLVTPPGPARIAEIRPGIGDRVARGDVLVRFEMPSTQADVAAREADLQRAHARLDNASAAIERAQSLFDRGVAARKEVEDARREMAESEAALSEAKSAASAAGALAQRLNVRALFGGVVAARTHNAGDLVDAGGDPILRVLDPDRLEVEASVPAHELPRVREGSPATVSLGGSDPARQARVRTVPAAVDPQTAIATVRLELLGAANLPAGAPVQVTILEGEKTDALVVPPAALVREGEDAFVYTVDGEGKAHRTKVTIGMTSDTSVEILSGVEEGASVIVRGQEGLPDGAAVATEPTEPKEPPAS